MLTQSLQKDNIDIVQDIKQVLKAVSTLQSLAKKDPTTVAYTQAGANKDPRRGDQKVYQGSTHTHYLDSMFSLCSKQALADLQKLDNRIKKQLE